MTYKNIRFMHEAGVARVTLANPDKRNALALDFWQDMPDIFTRIQKQHDIRVVVIDAEGPHYTSGIDLASFSQFMITPDACAGRQREALRRTILKFQGAFNAIDQCRVPVLCAIQGGCVGAGVDMISAADMRYGTRDSFYVIKEVDVGMTADVGTLQRLPKLIPEGLMRELAYTGRTMTSDEAESCGLLNRVFETVEDMNAGVMEIAQTIASKSPLAIEGSKQMITYARDHSVQDGLNYVATWNAGMLFSDDLTEALQSNLQKRPPVFADSNEDLF